MRRGLYRYRWTLLGVAGCLLLVGLISRLDASAVPAVSALPRADGLRVIAAAVAADAPDSDRVGRARFIALAGARPTTGTEAIRREVQALEHHGWTHEQTLRTSNSAGVVIAHRVPLGSENAFTELDDPGGHVYVVLDVSPTSFSFPEALWHSPAIIAAARRRDPVLQVQLGREAHG